MWSTQPGEYGLWTEMLLIALGIFIKCNSYLKKAGIQNDAYNFPEKMREIIF